MKKLITIALPLLFMMSCEEISQSCTFDSDCDSGEFCGADNTCEIIGCEDDFDCDSDELCGNDAQCHEECSDDNDCPAGESCNTSNYCD